MSVEVHGLDAHSWAASEQSELSCFEQWFKIKACWIVPNACSQVQDPH